MTNITRRTLLIGSVGVTGALTVGGLVGCGRSRTAVGAGSAAVLSTEATRRPTGQRVVTAQLNPRAASIDLGGLSMATWAYGETVPGPLLRASAGDRLRVAVTNTLTAPTSVHWHGIALRNDMDGVPGITQKPIDPGTGFTYDFTAPEPGTYFYHPHSGVQLDRGLHGVLIIDDPHEPGQYDQEWIVVLDDWIDGTGTTPDEVLKNLQTTNGSGGMGGGMGGMGGMGGSGIGESMQSPLLGGAGDIAYPHYLVNGRIPTSPVTLAGKPGQRVRMRVVNAGSDTAFRLALGGHRMTVTHTDGYPVEPAVTDALLIGMGERFDVLVTLADGAFPLVAAAEGKSGQGMAVVRTSPAAAAPAATATPSELTGRVMLGTDLLAAASSALPDRGVDTTHDLVLGGSMAGYRWTLNGKSFPDTDPLEVRQGQRVRLRFRNHTMMFHPMHVHGHTFALTAGGARKDTLIVRPMQTVEVDLQADNPGQWATHCHNIYHAEAGMMTTLSYQS
ncbi:copper oxidase [Humibacillus sp. DSM 29435]|uniref:multicopper oxidase family protein n=1 Tax=Humibacillus sp. DSM 29435 TaxID=1869167 RepID=UPI000872191C|nr:multicopper oxidase family protein [Humibacillus sp. DSM 29435]OFE17199.1 copper oxidase [Humibacillus sp. DSM 29435]